MNLKYTLLRRSERVPLRWIQKLEWEDEMEKLSIYSHTDSVNRQMECWYQQLFIENVKYLHNSSNKKIYI